MYIRCAFFKGTVKPGCEAAFNRYVAEQLVPIWTRFPGAQEVRVLRQVECDAADPSLEMVLAVRYPSREAIDVALASSVRFEGREMTKGLLEMFDGTVFHTVFEASQFALPAGA
ncbi:MAG: hypothetical protein RL375_549, partial [Pseudomonadota bacterium]|jgi:antibiotic biosynthesis monooxygenase (ABM) superfamily enzyme